MFPKELDRRKTLNFVGERRLTSLLPDEEDEELHRAFKKTVLPEDFGVQVAAEFEQQLKSGKLDENIE